MIPAKLGTAITVAFGPVLNVDGTPYVTDNLVPADFLLYKNGTPAAPNASATIAHAGQGTFTVTLTTSDISAVGVATLVLNKATLCAARVVLTVLPVAIYELLTTLTQTQAGYIVAAFKKLFDVQTPALTAASKDQGADNNVILASAAHGNAALKTLIDAKAPETGGNLAAVKVVTDKLGSAAMLEVVP